MCLGADSSTAAHLHAAPQHTGVAQRLRACTRTSHSIAALSASAEAWCSEHRANGGQPVCSFDSIRNIRHGSCRVHDDCVVEAPTAKYGQRKT